MEEYQRISLQTEVLVEAIMEQALKEKGGIKKKRHKADGI